MITVFSFPIAHHCWCDIQHCFSRIFKIMFAHASTHFQHHCCCHHAQVRAVKLRRERIVVALEHKVLVYDFKDLKLLHSIETLSNPLGLVALSPSQDQTVMACPGLHCGQVRSAQYAGYEAFVWVKLGCFAHLVALGLVSTMLHCVIVTTVKRVDLTGMHKIDCSGQTRLILHIPSSSRAGKRHQ